MVAGVACMVARGVRGCRGCVWLLGVWLPGACMVAGGHAWLLEACVVVGGCA